MNTTRRQCETCKQIFEVPSFLLKHRPNRFCSHRCLRSRKRPPTPMVRRKCNTCSRPFSVPRYLPTHQPAKYCSTKCMYISFRGIRAKWKITPIHCLVCGITKYRTVPNQRYCSPKCAAQQRPTGPLNPSWRGGKKIRSDGYIAIRINGKYVL